MISMLKGGNKVNISCFPYVPYLRNGALIRLIAYDRRKRCTGLYVIRQCKRLYYNHIVCPTLVNLRTNIRILILAQLAAVTHVTAAY